jgi:uncharacterized protein (DUF433 family)
MRPRDADHSGGCARLARCRHDAWEIISDYRELTEEDIRTCLSYADRERGVLIAA